MNGKICLLFFLYFLTHVSTFAQNIASYQLTENNSVGQFTNMAGSETIIGSGSLASSAVQNIGFNFVFMGRTYTTFSVNTNGVLRFGNEQILGGANTYGIPNNDRIAVLAGVSVDYSYQYWAWGVQTGWANTGTLLKTNDNGKVHFKVAGNAPNRVMTIEWLNVGFSEGGHASNGRFQLRLYESSSTSTQSGMIEMLYDNFTFASTDYQNFQFRTGFGIGPESGNFLAINHINQTLVNTQNYISGPANGPISYFSSSRSNDKLLYRFESFRKPVGSFTDFAVICQAPNSQTISFTEDCTDEAGVVIYRKEASANDSQYTQIGSVKADTQIFTDSQIETGKSYAYRFHLIGEAYFADTYQVFVSEPVEEGLPYQAVRSGNWGDATTWGGTLPGNGNDVELGCASAVFVSVTGSSYVHHLTIQPGSFLTIEDGATLYVSGNFVNNGVFNPEGSGKMVFNGTEAQAVTNNGKGITSDDAFSSPGPFAVWDDSQVGIVAEASIAITDQDFSAIKSISVDITHNYLRDLNIDLITPSGQVFSLAQGRGQQGQNYSGVNFVETGKPLPPTIQNVNLTGDYQPEESFAAYTGPFAGEWTLRITDNFTGGNGQLNSFGLILSKGISDDLVMRNVEIDKPGTHGLTLTSGVHVQNTLQLTRGVLYSNVDAGIFIEDGAIISGGGLQSYVDGPMYHQGTSDFTFPVGNDGQYSPVSLRNMSNGDQQTVFMVEYLKAGYGRGDRKLGITEVSQGEYWEIEPLAGSPTVDIRLHWKNLQISNLATAITNQDLVVAHYTNDQWENEGGLLTLTDVANRLGYIEVSGIDSFSPFTFGSEGYSTLPVELLSFRAESASEGVLLSWETASEENNSHFEVERSLDNHQWEKIGVVQGKGTTFQQQNYQFNDPQIATGYYYYRLRQVDFDGASEYSRIVAVSLQDKLETVFHVYPNPATDYLTIESSSYPATVEVFNLSGKIIHSKTLLDHETSMDLANLHDGIYMVRLNASGDMKTQKLLVSRH